MSKPRVMVLRAPGANCDEETAHAFELAGGRAERIHVNRLLDDGNLLKQFQILCVPGGFSYGDDIAAGRVLGAKIQHHLSNELRAFHDAGKLLLGICNGFQVLMKSGMLFDEATAAPPATLTWNNTGRYEARWVTLRAANERCVFLRGIEQMYLPVAHAEGKFVARDSATMRQLESQGQLPLRYSVADGASKHDQSGDVPFPLNPNGSQAAVAGLCDPTGRAFGLMPHPERHLFPTQHPRWTRAERLPPVGDGLRLFQNAVEYFA